jgi:hypothetical protein
MTFYVLYTEDKNTNDIIIISVHIGIDSIIKQVKNHCTQKYNLMNNIAIVPCSELSNSTHNDYNIVCHDSKCACGKNNTIELYRSIFVEAGYFFNSTIKQVLVDSYKYKKSLY